MPELEPLTEGRIVYLEQADGDTLAGIVTRVHDDGSTVDMQGFRDGQPIDVLAVPFSADTKAGHWSWHPEEPGA